MQIFDVMTPVSQAEDRAQRTAVRQTSSVSADPCEGPVFNSLAAMNQDSPKRFEVNDSVDMVACDANGAERCPYDRVPEIHFPSGIVDRDL